MPKLAQAIKSRQASHYLEAPSPDEATLILPASPYKALESFQATDEVIFAGRKAQSRRLGNRIIVNPLTVVYGESGSGKTSLLQAGVGPYLAKEQATPLIVCRLASGQPLLEQIKHSFQEYAGPLKPSLPAMDDLPSYIRAWQQHLKGRLVLVLDQMEQLLIIAEEDRRTADLETLSRLANDTSLNLHLVLVVREDFLGRLGMAETHLPGLLKVLFRLEQLDREAARAAIEQPAGLYKIKWEEKLLQLLLDELYPDQQGGIAPPQLQIVCAELFNEFAQQDVPPPNRVETTITLAQFKAKGGTQAILGNYLRGAVAGLAADLAQVRVLLDALVGSDNIKVRLSVAELTRITRIAAAEIVTILDQLTAQRLLQRYDPTGGGEQADKLHLEYELTHDYLAKEIVDWLGDEFRPYRRVREIVRGALPAWRAESRLLPPGSLRFITQYQAQVGFEDEEIEMIYGAAVSYNRHLTVWQEKLSEAQRRGVLLRLLGHSEVIARQQATIHLAAFADDDVISRLVERSTKDDEVSVREAATQALVQLIGEDNQAIARQVVEKLVEARRGEHLETAWQALLILRDFAPVCHQFLPSDLQTSLQKQVRRIRRHRHWQYILARTVRGLQGGFVGLAFLLPEIAGVLFGADLPVFLLSVAINGLFGAFSGGSGAFVGAYYENVIQDHKQPWWTWLIVTVTTAIALAVGFMVSASTGSGLIEPKNLIAGFMTGALLAGSAALPIGINQTGRLVLAVWSGMIAFGLIQFLGLFPFSAPLFLVLVLGSIGGLGFYWALRPDDSFETETTEQRERKHETD